MSIVFESTIKANSEDINDWYIELKLLETSRIENCNSIEEYSNKLNEICRELGILIEADENAWAQDENVTADQYAQVNSQMRKLQEEMNNDSND